MKAPNGNTSYLETHFEVVQYMTNRENDLSDNKVKRIAFEDGTGGLYELAEQLTDEFEELYKGYEFDGDFYDKIEDFLTEKLN